MPRPKIARKDKNHPALVAECRKLSMVVYDIAAVGVPWVVATELFEIIKAFNDSPSY